jgi:hypothetical protein
LVGVAVFSVPMSQAVIPKWLGVSASSGVELGRFVLLDEVPFNAETWFLARAVRVLRAELPELAGIVSFSDPVPRRDSSGALVMPGHVGTIYQARNAAYRGRTAPILHTPRRRRRACAAAGTRGHPGLDRAGGTPRPRTPAQAG